MSKSKKLRKDLMHLIQAAVDLSLSIEDDVKNKRGTISNTTIVLLNDFTIKHKDLHNYLDVINGIH